MADSSSGWYGYGCDQERHLMLVSLTPVTGCHCVPVMLTNTCCCGTTKVVSLGGAPVPLGHQKDTRSI